LRQDETCTGASRREQEERGGGVIGYL
jgi:hypothetical protein